MKKEFEYYIYIDYSENLIGYNIIEKEKIKELLPKLDRFRHYRGSKNRKIYLKHIKKTIKRDKILTYFRKIKISKLRDSLNIFVEVLEFIKKHSNCIIFISVDDNQYKTFIKVVKMIDGDKIIVKKESQLKRNSIEYKLSLIIDNLLNIERKKEK